MFLKNNLTKANVRHTTVFFVHRMVQMDSVYVVIANIRIGMVLCVVSIVMLESMININISHIFKNLN